VTMVVFGQSAYVLPSASRRLISLKSIRNNAQCGDGHQQECDQFYILSHVNDALPNFIVSKWRRSSASILVILSISPPANKNSSRERRQREHKSAPAIRSNS
jgi:hypothetical protein